MSRGQGRADVADHVDAGDASASPRRVILVGKTGLDARLRLDPLVELVRAGNTLDAIGELASGAAGTATGLPTTVVIASDADGAFAGPDAEAEVREFLKVVRESVPGARVLVAHRLGSNAAAPWASLLDGSIAADATTEAVRAALRDQEAPAPSPASTNGHAPSAAAHEPASFAAFSAVPAAHVSAPAAASADGEIGLRPFHPTEPLLPDGAGADAPDRAGTASDRRVWADTGDEALVRLLMLGKDPVPTALDLIRSRLSLGASARVVYTPEAEGPGAPVYWRGRVLGHLEVAGVATDRIAPHASWLGAWVALRDQHQQLRQAAFTDPLTGAYNRRFFDFFLRSTMEEAKAHRRSLTLMIFDIDDFKRFNDQHGHAAGDEILLHTMRLLKSVIRPADKVCRVGGDEFAVIFYDPAGPRSANSRHPTDVRQIAQRFQKEIVSQKFPKLGDQAPGTLTISAGLATYPWDGRTPEELLQTADELALRGKRQGKNVITFGPALGSDGDAPPDAQAT